MFFIKQALYFYYWQLRWRVFDVHFENLVENFYYKEMNVWRVIHIGSYLSITKCIYEINHTYHVIILMYNFWVLYIHLKQFLK